MHGPSLRFNRPQLPLTDTCKFDARVDDSLAKRAPLPYVDASSKQVTAIEGVTLTAESDYNYFPCPRSNYRPAGPEAGEGQPTYTAAVTRCQSWRTGSRLTQGGERKVTKNRRIEASPLRDERRRVHQSAVSADKIGH